jgi:uncharacterized protein
MSIISSQDGVVLLTDQDRFSEKYSDLIGNCVMMCHDPISLVFCCKSVRLLRLNTGLSGCTGSIKKRRYKNLELQMMLPIVERIKHFLAEHKAIKFAYLFGSYARGDMGPLSDIDLAVYLDNRFDLFTCRLRLIEKLDGDLKGKPFDLVILNNAPLVFRYEVIREGIVLKEDKPKRVQFEVHVLRDYLDTEHLRLLHRASLKKSFLRDHHCG